MVGVGDPAKLDDEAWSTIGGYIVGKLGGETEQATVVCELPKSNVGAESVAMAALGARLGAYRFDRYKTRSKDNEPKGAPKKSLLRSTAMPPPSGRSPRSTR